MLYNIIAVLGGILILIYVFTTREGFFGLVLGLASLLLFLTILGITGIPMDGAGLLAIVYIVFLGTAIFRYTFSSIGKVMNIFFAVIMWVSVYFNFITIDGGLLDGNLLDPQLIKEDPLKGLLIYLTVAGIASIFTLDSN